MHELTKGIKELGVDPAIERRLIKRVRSIMRKDKARIKAGSANADDVRKKAELSAIAELLTETNNDLSKL